ncbi:MAG: anti-sigma-F factor Fin [Sporomusaceae bacterium]|nr:anti-sigma-F factor Fin [Sporomusaceae bacterium]
MKVSYYCSHCQQWITSFFVESLDETKLGFDCLTEKERRDIIEFDSEKNSVTVQTICDLCYKEQEQAGLFLSAFTNHFIQ